MNKRSRKLAENHWKWIKAMLDRTKETKGSIKTIGVYYRAAFIHGFKHGQGKNG
jgi:hypothetical protein